MDVKCNYVMFFQSPQGPAEYCPEDAERGQDFCSDHDPERGMPDWDDKRKELLYECYD